MNQNAKLALASIEPLKENKKIPLKEKKTSNT